MPPHNEPGPFLNKDKDKSTHPLSLERPDPPVGCGGEKYAHPYEIKACTNCEPKRRNFEPVVWVGACILRINAIYSYWKR